MKLKTALLVFAVGIWAIPSAYAGPRSVDVSDFDIAGVKTGMDYKEALAAAANHFQIAPSKIKKMPDRLSYLKDGIQLNIDFVTRIPVDKEHPLVVRMVLYSIVSTDENIAAMKEAAVDKYGAPSGEGIQIMMWCANPVTYENFEGVFCPDQASLKMYPYGSLVLADPSWEEALSIHNDALNTKTPNL